MTLNSPFIAVCRPYLLRAERTEPACVRAAAAALIPLVDEMPAVADAVRNEAAALALTHSAAEAADEVHNAAAARVLIRYAAVAADAVHSEAAAADEVHNVAAAVHEEHPAAESRAVRLYAAFADERAPSCHAGHPFEAVWAADS